MLFGVFGLGALLLSPLMPLLGGIERCQPVVRAAWRPMVWLFVHLGLIRVDCGNLPRCRGTVIVANHPSLIDVMLFTVLVPRTLSIAKLAAGRNPIMGVVARSSSIAVGADIESDIAPYLSRGWNILIFPEGTRSPFENASGRRGHCRPALHPFHRGAAQLALRTGAPLICVGVRQSRRILAKGQHVWDIGSKRVVYAFSSDEPTVEHALPGESIHAAAIRVTADLERRVKGLLS